MSAPETAGLAAQVRTEATPAKQRNSDLLRALADWLDARGVEMDFVHVGFSLKNPTPALFAMLVRESGARLDTRHSDTVYSGSGAKLCGVSVSFNAPKAKVGSVRKVSREVEEFFIGDAP